MSTGSTSLRWEDWEEGLLYEEILKKYDPQSEREIILRGGSVMCQNPLVSQPVVEQSSFVHTFISALRRPSNKSSDSGVTEDRSDGENEHEEIRLEASNAGMRPRHERQFVTSDQDIGMGRTRAKLPGTHSELNFTHINQTTHLAKSSTVSDILSSLSFDRRSISLPNRSPYHRSPYDTQVLNRFDLYPSRELAQSAQTSRQSGSQRTMPSPLFSRGKYYPRDRRQSIQSLFESLSLADEDTDE